MKVEAATESLIFKTQHQGPTYSPLPPPNKRKQKNKTKKQLGAICRGGYHCVKPPSATSTQTGLKGFRGLQEACGSLPDMCCAKRAKCLDDGAEDFSTGGSSAQQEGCSENIRRCCEQSLRCSWGPPVYPRTTMRRGSCDCLLKNVDSDRTFLMQASENVVMWVMP